MKQKELKTILKEVRMNVLSVTDACNIIQASSTANSIDVNNVIVNKNNAIRKLKTKNYNLEKSIKAYRVVLTKIHELSNGESK